MIWIITMILGSLLIFPYLGYYILMTFYSKKGKTWESGDFLPNVSVIIPTYNEEDTIEEKLENLLSCYPEELLEIVLIDSGSTDETVNIIEKINKTLSFDHPKTKVLFLREKERKGKAHAVNIAYSKSSGEIKIISDADALLNKEAIKEVVQNFKDPQIGAVTGRQILINPNETSATKVEQAYRSIYEILRIGESFMDSTPIFHGELSAYRAELIEILPENKSADDSRMANLIRIKGYRAVYDPNAIFYEFAPSSFKERFIQKVRRGQGLIRIFWDKKFTLFRPKYNKYGLIIMPMEFFMHIISPFLTSSFLIFLIAGLPFLELSSALISLTFVFIVYFASRLANKKIIDLVTSFLSSQFFLLMGLLYLISGRSLHKWQKTEGIRKKWKKVERMSFN